MNSVPLIDVLPWTTSNLISTKGQTILVCDSTETDGKFLLHTLASQFLKSQSSSSSSSDNNNVVLWIGCGPSSTEQSIGSSLKQFYKSTSTSASDKPVQVIPVLLELMELLLLKTNQNNSSSSSNNNNDETKTIEEETVSDEEGYYESYLKSVYQRIRSWVKQTSSSSSRTGGGAGGRVSLIVLDNVSLLSTIVGPHLTYAFVQNIRSLILLPNDTSSSVCLAMVCSHDIDQEHYLFQMSRTTHHPPNTMGGTTTTIPSYIGSGGRGIHCNSEELTLLEQQSKYELMGGGNGSGGGGGGGGYWERTLIELADGVIDVVPLLSGFARDVHGRLVFTERVGSRLGWFGNGGGGGGKGGAHSEMTKQPKSTSTTRFRSRKQQPQEPKRNTSLATTTTSTTTTAATTTMVNYCCTENGVRAIRLRAGW